MVSCMLASSGVERGVLRSEGILIHQFTVSAGEEAKIEARVG